MRAELVGPSGDQSVAELCGEGASLGIGGCDSDPPTNHPATDIVIETPSDLIKY